jgi:ATP-binding cassette subfamily C protein
MEVGRGDKFFVPVDPERKLEVLIFAIEDCEICGLDIQTLRKDDFDDWFYRLSQVSWIRDSAGPPAGETEKWAERGLFEGNGPDGAGGLEVFSRNQSLLLSMTRAHADLIDGRTADRVAGRAAHRENAAIGSMGNLLGFRRSGMEMAELFDSGLDPACFVTKLVAGYLGMNAERARNDKMSAEMAEMTRVRRMAGKANIRIRRVKLPDRWHKGDNGALIGHAAGLQGEALDKSELVALIPRNGSAYRLYSISRPNGVTVNEDIAAKVAADAYACYPGLPMRKLDAADIVAFMIRNSWKDDWRRILLLSVIAGVLPLLLPVITQSLFQDVIPIGDYQALGTVVQVMLISAFTGAVLNLVRSISFLRIKNRAGVTLESALWSRLLSLPAVFFRKYEVGDIVSRMDGISEITEQLDNSVLSIVFNAVFSFWSLVLMFYYSGKLALIATAVWAVYLALAGTLYRRTITCVREKVKKQNASSSITVQLLNGISKFKLCGEEEGAFFLWSRAFGAQWKENLKTRWCGNYVSLLNSAQPVILSMILYYVTASSFARNHPGGPLLTYTQFIAFQTAFTAFNATLLQLVPCVAKIYSVTAQAENLKPIIEAVPEVTDDKADAPKLNGLVEAKDLRFKYGPTLPTVLDGISFSIAPGESVAFVGRSGCGKSTLIRVLLGFEAPSSGSVYFDGLDSSTLSVTSVRSQMGVVLQNGQILSGSIFTNIVGILPLSLDDAWEAARMVGIDKDIEAMPMGMYTMISEGGGGISGGQRQRLLIARSIVHKPRIIIMDEATSSLDNRTQAIVTESLKKLDATRIIVAQRLSTVKDADRIFVIDRGQIAEEGNFETLMEKNGLFAKMARRQIA